jgi:hypothetical protein
LPSTILTTVLDNVRISDTDLLGGAGYFLKTSSLATETAKVEELGAANFVGTNFGDGVDDLGVVREDALDALAEAHLGKGNPVRIRNCPAAVSRYESPR